MFDLGRQPPPPGLGILAATAALACQRQCAGLYALRRCFLCSFIFSSASRKNAPKAGVTYRDARRAAGNSRG